MDFFDQQAAPGFTQDMDGFGFGSVDLDQGQGYGFQEGWSAASQNYSRRSQSYHPQEVSHFSAENSPEQQLERKASKYLMAQQSTHSSKREPNGSQAEEQLQQEVNEIKLSFEGRRESAEAGPRITQNYSLECNLNSMDYSHHVALVAPAASLETCSLPSEIITVRAAGATFAGVQQPLPDAKPRQSAVAAANNAVSEAVVLQSPNPQLQTEFVSKGRTTAVAEGVVLPVGGRLGTGVSTVVVGAAAARAVEAGSGLRSLGLGGLGALTGQSGRGGLDGAGALGGVGRTGTVGPAGGQGGKSVILPLLFAFK